jgi:ankyrin repeat protein
VKIRDAAKRAHLDTIKSHLKDSNKPSTTSLLHLVVQDFTTIKKGPQHVRAALYLLEQGATPVNEMIYQASRGGHTELVKLLIDPLKTTDIHSAAAAGRSNIVDGILSSDPQQCQATDQEGKTPLHYCSASALGKKNPNKAAELQHIAKALLGAGAPINAAVTCGGLEDVTPLMHTCWTGGDPILFDLLIKRGAEPSYQSLWAAVGHFQRHGKGHYELASKLLQLGLDINHNDGRTLLHGFAAHEDDRGVAWLLEQGADVSQKSTDGSTPLHTAAKRNSGIKVIKRLLAAGASVQAVDHQGQTPVDVARHKGREKSVDAMCSMANQNS